MSLDKTIKSALTARVIGVLVIVTGFAAVLMRKRKA